MQGWPLNEARLVQYQVATSNADDLSIGSGACPEGKVWFVIGCSYMPSAAETRTINFEKGSTRFTTSFGLINPVSLALNPARCTFIEQGMQQLLLPGEYIIVRRDDHTAGSTMTLSIEYIEIDLPLYTYDEPQVVKREQRAIGTIRRQIGQVGGGSVIRGGALSEPGGGRARGTLPK